VENTLYIFVGITFGVIGSFMILNKSKLLDIEKKKKEAEEIISRAKQDSDKLRDETKERTEKFKKNSVEEMKHREERMEKKEKSIKYKEDVLDKKNTKINELKKTIEERTAEIKKTEKKIEKKENEVIEKLSVKVGKTVSSLKEDILAENEAILKTEKLERLAILEEKTKETAVKQAKSLLVGTIQRMTSPTSVETRAVIVKVPKDNIKGKIVGKNGRNIRYLEEKLPEVAIVFNDIPQSISFSCFNLVNRRIAQKTAEKLVHTKGDINEKVIDNAIEVAEKTVDEELYEIGKKYTKMLGIEELDKELVKIIGRLKYRTSYGQNIMKHSMEVAWVSRMLGDELGLNSRTCLIGGFLHDLGKAIDQDPNEKDSHDRLSKELMEKFNFSWEEVHAAWTHHNAIPQETPEALIVKAADAVSAGRPGARQESIFSYTERIQALEEVAKSFKGVKRVYTMSAGREVRMMANPKQTTDKQILELAERAAKKIEEDVTYPGKIKVNVIRRVEYREKTKLKK